jgi:hypothetical protein
MVAVRRVAAALLVTSAVAACTTTTSGHGVAAASCRPVFFGVPGSGQGVENPPPQLVPDSVSAADAARYGTTIGLLKTELAGIAGNRLASATAIDYPAIPVNRYVGRKGVVADLAVSEARGVRVLVAAIRHSYVAGCADRPVLLAGYSQGAEVVIRAVDRLTGAEQAHVAVALFGNPSYLPDQPGDYPGGTHAAGVRPSVERTAYTLPAGVRSRTIDVCAPGDGVCGVDPSRTSSIGKLTYVLTHTDAHRHAYAFEHNGYVQHAVEFLWQHR